MFRTAIACMLGVSFCAASFLVAQDNPKADSGMPRVAAAAAGQETFRTYCAPCHGLDAKGTGPVVPVLRYKPSDLTQLSKRNGGKFPPAVIEDALEDNHLVPAHGSRETPIWGDAFRNADRGGEPVKIRIHNLVLYIETIQEK
jgi:mono/diheme cytochrome c family protein